MSLAILWSVPRSRSTAFERMMYERGDFQCLHEPLSRVTDFGSVLLGSEECKSQADVARHLISSGATASIFVKDTTDFSMLDAFDSVPELAEASHALMWRAPEATVVSHLKLAPHATAADIGYGHMLELARRLASVGVRPLVIEGDNFSSNPREQYARYCRYLQVTPHDNPETFTLAPPPEWSLTARWHEDAATRSAVTSDSAAGTSPVLTQRESDLIEEVTGDYTALCAMFADELSEATRDAVR